jgi:Ca-activated chloride channel family protein
MAFAHPWVLLLLGLPIALCVWEWTRLGHRLVLPFDHGEQRRGRYLGRFVDCANLLPYFLLAVALLFMAGPQRQVIPETERVLNNILFCLDVSGSMTSPFGDAKRSDAAIKAINQFTTYRKGDAFGLTIFGNEVLHWVPITKDLSAIRLAAPFLRPEKLPPYLGGTQIAKALTECQKVLIKQKEGDRMIIIVSDGESPDLLGGRAAELGAALRENRIVVYYIHVADGAPQEEMGSIANTTGGASFAANDPNALHEVFRRIDSMQPTRLKPSEPENVDYFKPFALSGLALLGLGLAAMFGIRYTPW